MADLSKISVQGVEYDIKDAIARGEIGDLTSLGTTEKNTIVAAVNELLAQIASLNSITYIESTDTENLVSIRDLESSTYVFYGRFKPFAASTSTLTFSSKLLVNVVKQKSASHVMVLYPVNNCVQYLKVTDDTYERKNIYLNDLLADVETLTTEVETMSTGKLDASALTDAINTALAQAKESGEFDGADGADGTSVTIENITESTEDGGNNVVEFSDGNTLTVKNGGKGSAGGLSTTAANLLIEILRGGVYSEDQSANITALAAELGVTEAHTHSYTSAVTTAATCTTAGVRTYSCSCGDSYTEEIPATGHNYVDGVCTVCGEADPSYSEDVTLSSISATYSGGDVTVGTAVTDLTGIVVTAHYSDGSTETVTGYTLSGEIAEGENTVTVNYGDKTTTFTVTGVVESSGGDTEGEAVTMVYKSETFAPSGASWYTDGGETALSSKMTSRGAIGGCVSDEVFSKDTTVRIVLKNGYDGYVIASSDWDGSSTLSGVTNLYCQDIGAYAWGATEHDIEYTVKAGYRLAVYNYVNTFDSSNITVTRVAESDDLTVTNKLTNVTNNNTATSVEENAPYTATLTAADGYALNSVTVTMGGEDITETAYADGVVSIAAVTGNVVITATASVENSTNIFDGRYAVGILTNGSLNSASTGAHTSALLNCEGLTELYFLKSDGSTYVRAAAFYDADKTMIGTIGNAVSSSTADPQAVPDGAVFVRVSWANSYVGLNTLRYVGPKSAPDASEYVAATTLIE